MRIELANLEDGRGSFAHKYAPGELVLEDDRITITQAPEVAGEILVNGAHAQVKGNVRALLQVECDRCLKPIELPVKSTFDVEYVPTSEYEAQQSPALTESDLNVTVFDGQAVDI